LSSDVLDNLFKEHRRLSSVVVHSAPENRRFPLTRTGVALEYRTEVVDSPRCCGKIHPGYFVVDAETFTEVPLHSALAQRDFAALWSINKDQIAICKDCEFRYICTDCRAYLQDTADLYSKPSKCTYDPYTAEWQPQPTAFSGK